MTATVSILRRSPKSPSRRVEVIWERIDAHVAKLPTDEAKIAFLKAVLAEFKRIWARPSSK
jgi:hypothetical protein